jgi:hypothetical protein
VSGLATAWAPNANDVVNCITLGDTSVYVGGYFASIGGQSRSAFASLNEGNGAAQALQANVDQQVKQIVLQNGVLYLGGAFERSGRAEILPGGSQREDGRCDGLESES